MDPQTEFEGIPEGMMLRSGRLVPTRGIPCVKRNPRCVKCIKVKERAKLPTELWFYLVNPFLSGKERRLLSVTCKDLIHIQHPRDRKDVQLFKLCPSVTPQVRMQVMDYIERLPTFLCNLILVFRYVYVSDDVWTIAAYNDQCERLMDHIMKLTKAQMGQLVKTIETPNHKVFFFARKGCRHVGLKVTLELEPDPIIKKQSPWETCSVLAPMLR